MSLSKKLLLHEDPLGLLTPERIAELRAEARLKVEAKRLKAAEDKFLADEIKRFEREADPKPEYELRDVLIDPAIYIDTIRIDSQYFVAGRVYHDVPKPVYDQVQEIMARSHMHQREISAPTEGWTFSLNKGVKQGRLSGLGTNTRAQF